MKCLNLIGISILIFSGYCFSQTEQDVLKTQERKVYFGINYGIGVISPKDVNIFMIDYYKRFGIELENNENKIWLTLTNLEANLSYKVNKRIEIKGAAVLSWSVIKVEDTDMIGADNDKYNYILKLSPEIICNYHLFYFDNQSSIYLGGGITYNKIYAAIYEDYKFEGNELGLRFNCGFLDKNRKKHPLYYELLINLVKAKASLKDGDSNDLNNYSQIDYLNCSGFSLNFGVKF